MVRPVVANSWQRCAAAGPGCEVGTLPPVRMAADELDGYRRAHPLAAALPMLAEVLGEPAADAGHVYAVTDAEGMLLWVAGDAGTRTRVERMNFVPGALWSEAHAGTNAPGTALAEGRPVQIVAAEHYNPVVRPWSCVAAPVRDPDSGRVLGAIDITGGGEVAGSYALSLVRATARAAEADLAGALALADERARRAYARRHRQSRVPATLVSRGGRVLRTEAGLAPADLLGLAADAGGQGMLPDGRRVVIEPVGTDGYLVVRFLDGRVAARPGPAALRLTALGRDAAVVQVDGRTLRLTPRQSEILVALTLAAGGRSAGRLAIDLSTEDMRLVTVRAEMSKLRAVLGADVLDSQPYALRRPVHADFHAVRDLLAEGRVPDALSVYSGPLLPSSEAPAVVEHREVLGQQLRGAVLGSGDAKLLRRWVDAPWSAADGYAWRTLANLLPGGSAQRAAAASRARALMTA